MRTLHIPDSQWQVWYKSVVFVLFLVFYIYIIMYCNHLPFPLTVKLIINSPCMRHPYTGDNHYRMLYTHLCVHNFLRKREWMACCRAVLFGLLKWNKDKSKHTDTLSLHSPLYSIICPFIPLFVAWSRVIHTAFVPNCLTKRNECLGTPERLYIP